MVGTTKTQAKRNAPKRGRGSKKAAAKEESDDGEEDSLSAQAMEGSDEMEEDSVSEDDLTAFKSGQTKPTPSPVVLTPVRYGIGLWRPRVLRVPVQTESELVHRSEVVHRVWRVPDEDLRGEVQSRGRVVGVRE